MICQVHVKNSSLIGDVYGVYTYLHIIICELTQMAIFVFCIFFLVRSNKKKHYKNSRVLEKHLLEKFTSFRK